MVTLPNSITPSGSSSPAKSFNLKTLKRHLVRLFDAAQTEFNFRFRRKAIRDEMAEIRKFPRNLHIEGTNICNAKCTFCAYPQMERARETMPMETFRRIIDEYVEMGGRAVSLTPIVGDPFVDKHIFERLDYLNQIPDIKGFYFYTNGILMKPHVSQRLLEYGEKLHVYVSFGGFDRDTYKAIMGVDYFDLVCQNIEALIEAKRNTGSLTGFTLALRCPASNWHGDFWAKYKTWEQVGLAAMSFVGAFDSWAGKVKAEDLRNVGLEPTLHPYKRGACELLFMKPIVLANGKVNACACRDVEAELIVGDLNQMPLSELWAGQGIDDVIERHERGDFPEVCKRCTWYNSIYNLRKRQTHINWAAQGWNEEED
ncbi:MAG: radical SAM protein [Leptolyngbyaceae cyanobacterium RU_5_1]|nr:radical SAM protein [Leptolyngbyaceae cyanobacterium RU_5_1]